MPDCRECGFEAKTKGGLSSHRRSRHPVDEAGVGTVLAAVAAQLPDDAPVGLRAAALKLAWAMDATESTRDLASLSRELRATLAEMTSDEEPEADGVDDLASRRAARRAAAASALGSASRQ